MRSSPSIAPHDGHEDIYMVLDDFGSLGRAWRDLSEERFAIRILDYMALPKA
jgi:hypothetical protein